MGQFNFRKQYAIKQRYNETIGKDIPHSAGIYLWKREDEEITYFYVGQAKDLNKRRFDYYSIQCGLSYPTRHFEASLKKHKDWEFHIIVLCDESRLDELERYGIFEYLKKANHITRNELIAGKDIVKSNANRIHNVYTKYENNIKKMLKHIDFSIANDCVNNVIRIEPKRKKNGEFTELGMKAFTDFTNGLKGLLENGN